MSCPYFDLRDDVTRPNRWHLDEPTRAVNNLRGNEFGWATPLADVSPFRTGQRYRGDALDFTYAAFGVPIARRRLAESLAEHAPHDLQLIPVQIAGEDGEYCILNLLSIVDCLDLQESTVAYWPDDDLPELAGTIYSVDDPVIDPDRVGDHHIFRVAGWETLIVISERIAALLQGTSGVAPERMRCSSRRAS